jgi:hypothetical protein
MKRAFAALLTCLMAVSLALVTPGTAEAKKKKDTPGCVTKTEYNAAHTGYTPAQVAGIFDTWEDFGYWESHYDWQGNYTGEAWVSDMMWVDDSYYADELNWVSVVDTVRTYKKCKSFNKGRGRVAINFDNYSRSWLSGVRLAYKNPSDPSFMDVAAYFRRGARLAGKDVPTPLTKAQTPKPKAVPTSPKPAPNPTSPKPPGAHN